MTKLTSIGCIEERDAQKLKESGIKSVEELLEKAGSTQGRQEIALRTGINTALLLRWVNHADLFRIRGVGAEYAELLEAAGVDSSLELAHRSSEKLSQKLLEVNLAKNLVNKLPTDFEVDRWIQQAKGLAKIVFH